MSCTFARALPFSSAILLTLVTALLPTRASADPVLVTGGALTGDFFNVRLIATGERGLMLEAAASGFDGVYGPSDSCRPCSPGDLLSLNSGWSGSDFPGTASIDGLTFRVGAAFDGSLFAEFLGGPLVAPEFTGETLVSLAGPFLFRGFLHYPDESDLPREILLGRGIATVDLFFGEEGPNTWQFQSVRYEFSPIPEPGTLLLLATALTALRLRGRWGTDRAQ